MDFQNYLQKSWSEHAKNPKAVADQFETHFEFLSPTDDVGMHPIDRPSHKNARKL